jgi:hypothetical protein
LNEEKSTPDDPLVKITIKTRVAAIVVTDNIFLSEALFKPANRRIIKLVKTLIPVIVGKLKSDQLIP